MNDRVIKKKRGGVGLNVIFHKAHHSESPMGIPVTAAMVRRYVGTLHYLLCIWQARE